MLEGDIYQRHVLLCGNTRPGGSVAGLTSRLIRRGAEAARTTDPEALTGKLVDIVAHVANTLAAFGERLIRRRYHHHRLDHAPLMLEPDEVELTHILEPIGEVSVSFSRQ